MEENRNNYNVKCKGWLINKVKIQVFVKENRRVMEDVALDAVGWNWREAATGVV